MFKCHKDLRIPLQAEAFYKTFMYRLKSYFLWLNRILILSHIVSENRSADFSQSENHMRVIVSCKTYNFTCSCLEGITMPELNVLYHIKCPSISIHDFLFATSTLLYSKKITTMPCHYKIVQAIK